MNVHFNNQLADQGRAQLVGLVTGNSACHQPMDGIYLRPRLRTVTTHGRRFSWQISGVDNIPNQADLIQLSPRISNIGTHNFSWFFHLVIIKLSKYVYST